MQLVDFTTLTAACGELRTDWVPGRLEQVYQRDRHTIALGLRTLKGRGWLTISWHPQAARIGMGDPPPRIPDTFTFSDQLRHQLNGLALVAIEAIAPWERVLDLQFAQRPTDPASWHLYVEIMGKYSNVILTDANHLIVTAAHQVSSQQSSVRPIQTGQPYELPPALMGTIPNLSELQERWQERISLVPGKLQRQLLKSYRGLSPALVHSMIQAAGLDPNQSTESLALSDWQQLFHCWQEWLQALDKSEFQPGWTEEGYTVVSWVNSPFPLPLFQPAKNVQTLLNSYYTDQLNQQEFAQLHNQLTQKLGNSLAKLRQKASSFEQRLQESDEADEYRQQADLLMAYLQDWQPGMKSITLPEFETNKPVTIPLNPEKNAVQNAQALYKRHQKLKRARQAVEPLLQDVQEEIQYLEQVEAALRIQETYNTSEDLQTLAEIREELIQQGYLDAPEQRSRIPEVSQPYRYRTPSGFDVLIGRNNRQNDRLTFRTAGDYDLWFHSQEIAGSHVLLRLEPGTVPDEVDLQFAANLAAYYSQGRQSDQVPIVYTKPKHVYKPKGAKPGMAIYKQEQILWGRPQEGRNYPTVVVFP
ncbi:MAG TPA: hypothetical protein DDZ80_21770 [Cyanobacteria bacterium UBA8803]|nr:hypothetical protein [Cyanobacteria bacterium UBA8803]